MHVLLRADKYLLRFDVACQGEVGGVSVVGAALQAQGEEGGHVDGQPEG